MLSDQELIDGLRAELAELHPPVDLLRRLEQAATSTRVGSRRSWARPHVSVSSLLAGVGVAAAVAVVAVFATSIHHGASTPPTTRVVTADCGAAGARELARGAPPKSLLTILGVLRRPQRAQDRLPRSAPPFYRNGSPNYRLPASAFPSRSSAALSTSATVYPYVRYVRRARTSDGLVDYLIPLAAATNLAHPDHCSRPFFAGMALLQTGGGGQSSTCCLRTTAILARRAGNTTSSSTETVLTSVVPDQVATVTVYLTPQQHATGHDHTITASPVGNIVSVRVPPNARARVVWRTASGQIIKPRTN
jgi:hypothetical protein